MNIYANIYSDEDSYIYELIRTNGGLSWKYVSMRVWVELFLDLPIMCYSIDMKKSGIALSCFSGSKTYLPFEESHLTFPVCKINI